MKIAAISVGPSSGLAADLLHAAERSVCELAGQGVALVVLPELFALPYYAESDPAGWQDVAEDMDGPTVSWSVELAARKDVALVFGLCLAGRPDEKPANAAVLVAPGQPPRVVAEKVHLPPRGPSGFGEVDHFRSSDPTVRTFDYRGFCFAVLICFDRRFPESWRAAARAGAEIVLIPVAGPADTDPLGQFEAELRTHARANAVYALSAARFGTETVTGSPVRHDGETMAVTPLGERLASGRTAVVDLSAEALSTARNRNPTHRLNRFTPARGFQDV